MDLTRIINARETLEDAKERLLKYYTEEYGKKYYRRIKQTLETTCYIFDSKPNWVIKYFIDHNKVIPASIYEEYELYERFLKRKKDIIARVILKVLYPYSTKGTYEDLLKDRQDIANLNITLLSSSAKKNYEHSASYEDYLKLVGEIRHELEQYGIILPQDQNQLDAICKEVDKVRKDVNLITIDTDPYAEKIRRKIYEENGLIINREGLNHILNDYKVAGCTLRYNARGAHYTMVYLPFFERIEEKNPDLAFYHENRHAIESHNKGMSFTGYGTNLVGLNEVRTEKRAFQDNENLGLLFAGNTPYKSAYVPLIPTIDSLDEKYKGFIDECAITGSLKKMERAFGKENLAALNEKITENIFMCETTPMPDCSALLEKMDEHAISRGIKPYQKVK